MSAIDVSIDSLNEVVLQFLQLAFFLGPVPGVGSNIDGIYILVVVYQCVDSVLSELESDLVLRHHVNVDHIAFNVYHLVVVDCLNKRIGVLLEFRVRGLGHDD